MLLFNFSFEECKTVEIGELKAGICCVFPFQDCSHVVHHENGNKCVERNECQPQRAVNGTILHWCSTVEMYYGVVGQYGYCEQSCPKCFPGSLSILLVYRR